MEFCNLNFTRPFNAYSTAHGAYGDDTFRYPDDGIIGSFQQPMWPGNAQSAPLSSPPFPYQDSVALHYNYNAPVPPMYVANLQFNVEAFNAGPYRGYTEAKVQPLDGLPYDPFTTPSYIAESADQDLQNDAFQYNYPPFCSQAQSYNSYSSSMEKGPYGADLNANHTANSTPEILPLHFAQPYIHDATQHPEDAQTTQYNNIRWVNMDPTAAETGFKTPACKATKTSSKKTPAKSSKGIKKPRYKLTVEDKKLLFRSCVTKTHDRCFWRGCKDIVFTDRGSIKEHMKDVHGLDITLKARVDCRWTNCRKNLCTASLFRHITNSHMHVVEAHCLYGCGEVFSRVDGRGRHMAICPKRPVDKSD